MLGTAAATLTLTLAFGSAASADEDDAIDYNRLGGYLQVAGVGSYSSRYNDGGGGLSLRTGNRFHRSFAIEFQYEWVTGLEPSPMFDLSSHQITFNFRLYPFAGGDEGLFGELAGGVIQPYALTGIGVGIFDADPNRPGDIGFGVGFVARFGIGVDFYVSENIALSPEVTYALSTGGTRSAIFADGRLDVDDFDLLQLSFNIAYRF